MDSDAMMLQLYDATGNVLLTDCGQGQKQTQNPGRA
jgi:hypothetical protein